MCIIKLNIILKQSNMVKDEIQIINHSFFCQEKNTRACSERLASFLQTSPSLYLIDCKEDIN